VVCELQNLSESRFPHSALVRVLVSFTFSAVKAKLTQNASKALRTSLSVLWRLHSGRFVQTSDSWTGTLPINEVIPVGRRLQMAKERALLPFIYHQRTLLWSEYEKWFRDGSWLDCLGHYRSTLLVFNRFVQKYSSKRTAEIDQCRERNINLMYICPCIFV